TPMTNIINDDAILSDALDPIALKNYSSQSDKSRAHSTYKSLMSKAEQHRGNIAPNTP
ncbi:hypothetical protein BGZ94_005389, partial [Podila epigama]